MRNINLFTLFHLDCKLMSNEYGTSKNISKDILFCRQCRNYTFLDYRQLHFVNIYEIGKERALGVITFLEVIIDFGKVK